MGQAIAHAVWLLLVAQSLDDLQLRRIIELRAPLDHVQGIDAEGSALWISSVDAKAKRGYLDKFDLRTGNRLARTEVTDGVRFHPGGIALDGDSVWVPVAEYRPASSAVIQRRHKRTLALAGRFTVNDHIGCVAAAGDRLLGGNWDSRDIYEWDRAGRLLRKRPNTTGNRYQDMKMGGGCLVASGVLSVDEGAIDWLDPATLGLVRRIRAGKTDRGVRYTNEGMTLRRGLLYLAPEDGPSRVFVFAVAAGFSPRSGPCYPR